MAHLTADEFSQTIRLLADDLGLHRLRERLVRLNALVARRGAPSADALADQLYMLTGGLRRQVPATVALQALWSERVTERLGEDGDKEIEAIAEQINQCLGEKDRIVEGKETEIDGLLERYEERLARSIGGERARLDMLLKAVPAVAEKLRARPVRTEPAPDDAPSS
jgi:hypothetical protein